ncbi:hypothetical protein ACFQ15_03425 [Sphingomonas hankookensis]|uniref:hypothetical protein n=1 Tax=Sphingomonas hankookensis TaxID=563996 RepID=UPI001F57855C|nr:hypothetical protein [Sphingomonas hankookensis]
MSKSTRPDQMLRPAGEERDYLLQRAEVHRQIAENTAEGEARMIHDRLSRLYEEQAALVAMVLTD